MKSGAKLKLRIYGDSALTVKAKPVAEINGEIRSLAETMISQMRKSDGIGLAATQVGVPLRLFVLEVPAPKDPAAPLSPGERELLPKMPIMVINPELVSFSKVLEAREEGCLSVPQIYADVVRPASVQLKGQLLDGAEFLLDCGGLLGRAIQHEFDHLNGIVFVDRLSDVEYAKVKAKLDKLVKTSGHKSVIRRILGALQ